MKLLSIITLEKEEEKKQGILGANPGFDPGPLVPNSDTLTTA